MDKQTVARARYPKGHPKAGAFMPSGRVDAKALRRMLASAVVSTDPDVQRILDEYAIVNPDATRRRRQDGEAHSVTSEQVRSGVVLDQVRARGVVFHRIRDGILPGYGFEMLRVQCSRPLSDDEIVHGLQIVGYVWRQHLAGDRLEKAERDTERSFLVWCPSETSVRTDVDEAIAAFCRDLPGALREGSPIRTSQRIDRATGKPVAGTRLVDGLGEDLHFEVYADFTAYDPKEHA